MFLIKLISLVILYQPNNVYFYIRASDLWKIAAESGEMKCASSIGMKHGDYDGSFLQAKQLEFVRKQHVEKLSGVKIDRL